MAVAVRGAKPHILRCRRRRRLEPFYGVSKTTRTKSDTTAVTTDEPLEIPAPVLEPSPERTKQAGLEDGWPERHEIYVPMRVMDEWALWSFLEARFGDSNFSVVVSLSKPSFDQSANDLQQRSAELAISTPAPVNRGLLMRKCSL
jgi:hypothetical protein